WRASAKEGVLSEGVAVLSSELEESADFSLDALHWTWLLLTRRVTVDPKRTRGGGEHGWRSPLVRETGNEPKTGDIANVPTIASQEVSRFAVFSPTF
ncbi:hypothetical protein N8152_00990, partial [bacterium]|nr:hypothetical protein [bacterium]